MTLKEFLKQWEDNNLTTLSSAARARQGYGVKKSTAYQIAKAFGASNKEAMEMATELARKCEEADKNAKSEDQND
jgi:hypothetical protein